MQRIIDLFLRFPSMSLFLLLLPNLCVAFTIPEGWRIPTIEEYMNEIREESGKGFPVVQRDLNGDGLKDEAGLLVTEDGSKMGITVWVSNKGHYESFIPGEGEPWPKHMGISSIAPGEYKTTCGKGYFECGADEPGFLVLGKDAINYFQFESANPFFYRDSAENIFKGIWMSG